MHHATYDTFAMTVIDLSCWDGADTDRGDPDKFLSNSRNQLDENAEFTNNSDNTSIIERRVRVLYTKKSLRKRTIQKKDLMPFEGVVREAHKTKPNLVLVDFDDGTRDWIDFTNKTIFSFLDTNCEA